MNSKNIFIQQIGLASKQFKNGLKINPNGRPLMVNTIRTLAQISNAITKLNRYDTQIRQWARDAMIESAKVFVNTIALWTPPNIGKKPPTKRSQQGNKLYNRPIYYLPQEVKKNSRSKDRQRDLAELKKGKLFKVQKVLNKKTVWVKYYKKKNRKTKQDAVIHMRYLTRAAWGANMDQIEGAKLPINVKSVMSRNKFMNANAKKYNKIQFVLDRNMVGIRITNNTNTQPGGWYQIAWKKAIKVAEDKQRRLVKALQRRANTGKLVA